MCHPCLNTSVFLVSTNAVFVLHQNSVSVTAVNSLASITVSSEYNLEPSSMTVGVELDQSRWAEDSRHNIFGSLKNGYLLQVQTHLPHSAISTSTPVRIGVSLVAASIVASCMCISSSDYIFLGSGHTDSLLLAVDDVEKTGLIVETNPLENSMTVQTGESSFSPPPTKRRKLDATPQSPSQCPEAEDSAVDNFCSNSALVTSGIEAEEISLYGKPVSQQMRTDDVAEPSATMTLLHDTDTDTDCTSGSTVKFTVADVLPTIGPILHGSFTSSAAEASGSSLELSWDKSRQAPVPAIASSQAAAAAYIVERESRDCLQICAGLSEGASSVTRLTCGLRMTKVATRDISSASSICSVVLELPSSSDSSQSMLAKSHETLLFLSFSNIPSASTQKDQTQKTRLLVLSNNGTCPHPNLNLHGTNVPTCSITKQTPTHC